MLKEEFEMLAIKGNGTISADPARRNAGRFP
jgi:hypothetical protein